MKHFPKSFNFLWKSIGFKQKNVVTFVALKQTSQSDDRKKRQRQGIE